MKRVLLLILSLALMIFAISKLKIHPFLSIMGVSLIFAFIAGIPLKDIPGIIGSGFSGTFTSIGIVIILGALIGTVLEKTGGALKLSDMVIKIDRAQIQMLVSNAAPSLSGCKIAKEGNITLVGFLRGNRFNIYTNPERVIF